jgi:hypothetical protein
MRRLGRLILALALVSGSGCFTRQPVGALRASQELPRRVTIYRYNGDVIHLDRSRVEADTIRGYPAGSVTELRVPLAHVDSMSHLRFERRETAVATGVLLFVVWRTIASGMSKLQ